MCTTCIILYSKLICQFPFSWNPSVDFWLKLTPFLPPNIDPHYLFTISSIWPHSRPNHSSLQYLLLCSLPLYKVHNAFVPVEYCCISCICETPFYFFLLSFDLSAEKNFNCSLTLPTLSCSYNFSNFLWYSFLPSLLLLPFSSVTQLIINVFILKGLSHEMDLAFDYMHGQF